MARPQVPDTTVLIDLIRHPDRLPSFLREFASGDVYLSSVVTTELYAGTRSREEAAFVDQIARVADRTHRLLIPTAGDWSRAGRLISRRIRLAGDVRPRDHLADVLIVASASRLRGTVVSANARHMEAWVRLARRHGLDVTLAS